MSKDLDDFPLAIAETVREPLLLLDSELRVRFANRAFYRAFQVAPADTDGRRIYDLGNGQWDIPALRTLLEDIIPDNTSFADYEVAHDFPSIGHKVMVLNARKLYRPGNHTESLLLSIEDVTSARQQSRALREQEKHFRLLVEGATDYAMFLVDVNGCIASWNVGAERITGYGETEVLGQSAALIFTEEDQARGVPDQEIATARETGQAQDKRWHRRKDGSRFFADGIMERLTDADGALEGFAKVMRDATASHEASEKLAQREASLARSLKELQASEERLRLATSAAQVGLFDYDMVTNTRFWDERCRRIMGLPADVPLTEEAAWSTIHPDDAERTRTLSRQAMSRGETNLQTGEYRIISQRDGERGQVRWVLWQGEVMYENGKAKRFLGTVRDITEQKRLAVASAEVAAKNERIAETLQRSLLHLPHPDAFPGLKVASVYEAAWDEAMVGGDFCDVFAVDMTRVALVVGDVTGKGLRAATYTAEIKFALRAFLRENPNPAEALTHLNRFVGNALRFDPPMLEEDGQEMPQAYVALALAVVDRATGKVECATAGGEPPLLVRGTSGDAVEMWAGGPLLGVMPDASYTPVIQTLESGDLVVMATDGITEARQGRQFFGYEGLTQAAQAARHQFSLTQLAQTIVSDAVTFAGGKVSDDVCLLVARRRDG